MQLFFLPDLIKSSTIAQFSSEESKHLYKVLRKKVGEAILITNGNNFLFEGIISNISKNECLVNIQNIKKTTPLPYSLHVGISLLKSNERFEWFLEKANEIGITEITPLICERTEKKFINEKRFNKILISSMKQSLKTFLPKLNPLKKLKDFVAMQNNNELFIAHCNSSKKNLLVKSIKPNSSNTILIGPEGDFTKKEIEICNKNKFQNVSLGDTRLRAETAGIVACHTFSVVNL
jgi:16S rRNA (uracil1498-N3)-methyltransferase